MNRLVLCAALAACGGSQHGDGSSSLPLPAAKAKFDYQLGGAYPPPAGVTVVARDRNAATAAGLYNICYVNGFQIQPADAATWQSDHPELILNDSNGDPIIDSQWNEMLIDVTAAKRAAVAAVIDTQIDACKQAGFEAVEIDNLDSYTRSQGLLSADDAVAMQRLYADHAHGASLPLAQKNAPDLVARRAEMTSDFAVVEECNHFHECDAYTAGYGDHVLVIEYQQADFDAGCQQFPQLSTILRDTDLATPSHSGYVYAGC